MNVTALCEGRTPWNGSKSQCTSFGQLTSSKLFWSYANITCKVKAHLITNAIHSYHKNSTIPQTRDYISPLSHSDSLHVARASTYDASKPQHLNLQFHKNLKRRLKKIIFNIHLWTRTADLANITVMKLLRFGRLLWLHGLHTTWDWPLLISLPRTSCLCSACIGGDCSSCSSTSTSLRLLRHIHGGSTVQRCVVPWIRGIGGSYIGTCWKHFFWNF